MKRRAYDQGRLAEDLASLPGLTRDKLTEKWQALFDIAPPVRVSHQFMVRAIAHRLQENALGGLKPAIRRYLEKVALDAGNGKQVSLPSPAIKPGTRLLREWHGITYEVAVTENGVQFQGKQYKSLSEVARIITGVKWSGPLFFGLKRKRHDH
jgi:hypothetical protein